MELSPLGAVQHLIKLGAPLQFNVRNADGTLLLARGRVIRDEEQLDALLERGAVVEAADTKDSSALIREAPLEQLPEMWRICMSRVGRALNDSVKPDFTTALDEASKPVLALIQRDADLAIFQLVQQDSVADTSYGVAHSIHAAVAAYLVAGRLGWNGEDAQRASRRHSR